MAEALAIDRVPPHSLDAEKGVLGAILIHNDAFDQAAEVLGAEDFYRDAHRRIFHKMAGLHERRVAIDLLTLTEELRGAGDLDAAGGPAYIASLADGVPRSSNVEYYARIIKEKSTLRHLLAASQKIHSSVYDGSRDAGAILDDAERLIFEVAEDRVREGFVPLRDLVQGSFSTIEKLQAHKGPITGVPSGLDDLDALTSGFQPSDLVIIAARPSMGKTSLVMNIAQHVGRIPGQTVGIFSLEMSKEQLFLRMLTAESRIDSHKFRGGYLSEADYERLATALAALAETSVYIDDSPGVGVMEMRAKSRRLAAEHGLSLLIVDYIQLMQGTGRFENRVQELGSISRSLKILAKELGVPVIALSQLSRAPEARAGGRPQLSDLRESGALEQDADVVVLIYREHVYSPTDDNEGVAQLIIAKQRNGPTGEVDVAFIRQFTSFANLDRTYR